MYTADLLNQRLNLENSNLQQSFSMIQQVRKQKHELKNQYFFISSLIKSNKYDELEQYVDTELSYRYDAIEEFNTGNQLMDFLLTQKITEAREQNIRVMTNIILPVRLPIDDNDLCSLLLNLFNNAIEASKEEKHADIQLNISVVKKYLQIHIKNKTSTDILKNNPALQTTKKDHAHHGYGLQVVQSVVEKYNGILQYNMSNKYFSVIVMLGLNSG